MTSSAGRSVGGGMPRGGEEHRQDDPVDLEVDVDPLRHVNGTQVVAPAVPGQAVAAVAGLGQGVGPRVTTAWRATRSSTSSGRSQRSRS